MCASVKEPISRPRRYRLYRSARLPHPDTLTPPYAAERPSSAAPGAGERSKSQGTTPAPGVRCSAWFGCPPGGSPEHVLELLGYL